MRYFIILFTFIPLLSWGGDSCISGNCVNGQGTFQFNSGSKYVGEFKNSNFHGVGTYYYANRSLPLLININM